MTPAEEALMDAYIAYTASAPEGTPTPPPGPIRSMAEWEEIEYLTITWAGYRDILAQIVDHAQEECTVIINCNDSNHVINQLAIRGVPNQNLRFIEQNYNSVWIRDYGPNSVYLNDVDSLVLVDWIYNRPRPADDQVPGGIANAFNYALYTSDQAPNDLVHTGGNFMSEGTGIGFSSDLVVRENGASGQFNLTVKTAAEVDSLMKDFMAIDPYIRMDELPHDIISHIDMHMKLLNENTLLVGEFPQGVSDGPQIEANLQYVLTNFSPRHGSWNIIRIPMPPSTSGNYAPNAHYRTYTNSIFINKTVLVPTYRKEYDTTALRIYEEALPGYHIVPINCEDIIPAAGALHCIAHSIGLRKPLLIQHWPREHWSTVHDTIDVHATIRHHSGISSATLYFRFTPDSVFTPLAMNAVGSHRWMGRIMNTGTLIPPDGPGLEYFEYYIQAHSHDGTVARRPLPAPEGYFRARIAYGLFATVGATNVTTCGVSDGSIHVSISGGTPPYSYLWNTGGTTSSLNNLSEGTYQLTVTDAAGSAHSLPVSINVLSATGGATDITCHGANDGSIDLTISGGTPGYTYAWDNGLSAGTSHSNLSAGIYRLSVTDGNQCEEFFSYTLTDPDVLTVSEDSVTNVSCFGGNDGALAASVSGGTSPYSYLWNTGGTTSTLSNLTAGTYRVTVTDSNSCSDSLTISITEPTDLVATSVPTNISCHGANDGSINLTVTGGSSPYSYLWNTGDATSSLSNLTAGTYRVTVTDSNSCSDSLTISITEPTDLVATSGSTNISCHGANDGAIDLTVTGGSSPYSYLWNTGGTTSTLSGLTAGTYRVTVTDANSCSDSLTVSITKPTDLVATSGSTNISCHGANDGAIDLTVTGGSSPYSYLWNTGGTTSTLSGLTAGTYRVTVTDDNGCTDSISVSITQPGVLVATVGATNVTTCGAGDGSINVSISGGTPPYSYLWNTGSTTSSLNDLGEGTYQLTVTDVAGCTQSLSVSINALSATSGATDITCHGANNGSIDLTISGSTPGYTYEWDNGATGTLNSAPYAISRNNLSGGTYQVSITDVSGCGEVFSYTITEPDVLTVSADSVTNVSCFGGDDGALALTVSGGILPYSYLWNTGSTTSSLSNLTAGTYRVTVADANSCSDSLTVSITEPTDLIVTSGATNISCHETNDGAINVTVSGGTSPYSYSWNTGSTTSSLNNLSEGTYRITVTDANSCSDSLTVSITEPTDLVATSGSTNISCQGANDGSINVTVTGGSSPYSYSWNTGDITSTLTNLTAGSYQVTVSDATGCTQFLSVNITQPSAPLAAAAGVTNVTCNGGSDGSINLTVSGGTSPYSYMWNTGGTTSSLNNLSEGTYQLTVTDAAGCTHSLPVSINALSATSGATDITCHGANNGSIDLTISGGAPSYTYEWDNGATGTLNSAPYTILRNNLSGGTYQVSIADVNGCGEVFSYTITEPDVLIVSADSVTNVSCFGGNDGALALTVSGGILPYSYLWNTGGTISTLSNLTAGTYRVTVTDSNSCSDSLTISITEPTDLVATSVPTNISCHGANDGSINVTVSGGTSPYSYSWNTGGTTSTLSNLTAGTYRVTVTDANSCSDSLTVSITESTDLVATSVPTNISCHGANDGAINVTVTGGSSPYSYSWNTGDITSTLTNLTAGSYQVTVSDATGCTQFLSVNITQPSAPLAAAGVTNVTCNGGSDGAINLTVTGGSSPYSYSWNTGDITSTLTNLTAGSYQVTVSDATGCTQFLSVNITQPSAPLAAAAGVTNVTCNGGSDGSINVTVSGGTSPYSYLWNMGSTTSSLNNLSGGTYQVSVTDVSGCGEVFSYTINEPTPITIDITVVDQVLWCNNYGYIYYTISGGSGTYIDQTWDRVSPDGSIATWTWNTAAIGYLVDGFCRIHRIPVCCKHNGFSRMHQCIRYGNDICDATA